MCCAEGDEGHVYAGALPYAVDRIDAPRLPRPRTKVMLIVGDPEPGVRARQRSRTPASGSPAPSSSSPTTSASIRWRSRTIRACRPDGGARTIAGDARRRGRRRRSSCSGSARASARIAAAFYPKPVIVRTSDFKTNEYARLLGGREFEPDEENPMIGFRGASRYYDPRYADGFALECAALRRVRVEMGLTTSRS